MHQCPPSYATDATVQYGWTVETQPKLSFQISLIWQVSTRVKGVEIQSLVIKTVCCRSKYNFHWTAPPVPPVPRWSESGGGGIVPHTPRLRRPCTFDVVTLMEWGLFLGAQPRPHTKTADFSAPQFLGFSCIFAYIL